MGLPEPKPQADHPPSRELDALAADAARLGHDIVDVAGYLDTVATEAQNQRDLLTSASAGADQIVAANASVIGAIGTVSDSAHQTLDVVNASVDRMRNAAQRNQEVASWVQDLGARMVRVEEVLKRVLASNAEIANIASQVNILAINAKIEAARAGEAGKGFAVVADAINEFSQNTTAAATTIRADVQELSEGIGALRTEAESVSEEAQTVLSEATDTDAALTEISKRMDETVRAAEQISTHAEDVRAAGSDFGPVFHRITDGVGHTTENITVAKERANGLIDASERIVQGTISIGADSADRRFIDKVCQIAADISEAFEAGIAKGQISAAQIFDQRYQPIPGTDPQQVVAPFTQFTDKVLPPIQEAALEFDPGIVFCAAVDKNGYLPTHNRKFSQPQSVDPVWNAANCRNRRMFNDRVGLKAGQSTTPFLLQVYRRDMGGGEFAMMKDLSAPIMVEGRHWGGVRLAYRF